MYVTGEVSALVMLNSECKKVSNKFETICISEGSVSTSTVFGLKSCLRQLLHSL